MTEEQPPSVPPGSPEPSEGIPSQKPKVLSVEERLRKLEDDPPPKKKDFWDKLTSLSGLVSGIIVAVIGFYATNVYDQRTKDSDAAQKTRTTIATELQTVEKFLPYLASKDETTKKAAILAVSSLGNTDLAARLATLFGGTGANAALTAIASSSAKGSAEKAVAQTALRDIYTRFSPSILHLTLTIADGQTGEKHIESGTTFVIAKEGYAITAAHLFSANPALISLSVDYGSGSPVFPAELERLETGVDLALIKIKAMTDLLPIIGLNKSQVGENVSVLGFPVDSGLRLVAGVTSSIEGPAGKLLVSAPVSPGMSGSPVFGAEGNLIGVVSGRLVNDSVAVVTPIQFAQTILQAAAAH